MDWIERMNTAINYIEAHITEELDFAKIAQIACTSAYHFQRIFICMTGMSLSGYIRRRKMTLAVADVKNGNAKIVDIALKYGYNSPTAFNRAFQSIHGIAPSLVRQDGVTVKSYPPISFKITVKGVDGMNYRIEKKESFRIVGLSAPLDNDFYSEYNQQLVSSMWQLADTNGTTAKLLSLMDGQPTGLLGVMVCDDSLEEWRYFAAVSSKKEIDSTLEAYIVPPYTWAIFSGEGNTVDAIKDLGIRVITEWLPTSGYEYDNGPDIEVYLSEAQGNAKFEFWMPVKKA
ncbi:MAG: AraC family transcriptional regulator [Defluviitaleaceae bacterium]|nr:AraC family transcriptional regulator [Defluviitaleaceae bacterium]